MKTGQELEPRVYESEHIRQVLAEMGRNFPDYFATFAQGGPLRPVFLQHIEKHRKEQDIYRDYIDLEALEEFESDPNAFKSHSRKRCPIIRRCLNSTDEAMKAYHVSFQRVSGRDLLNPVRKIAEFGAAYVARFDDEAHEAVATYSDLGLERLDQEDHLSIGVLGYGIQSSLLYGVYPRQFAHRSQDAVWAFYFLSGRKNFGLRDDSEFLMVHPQENECEQNYYYPAQLFGFYALQIYPWLKAACAGRGLILDATYRYVYLSRFCDQIADTHRSDINVLRRSSEHVERQPWF